MGCPIKLSEAVILIVDDEPMLLEIFGFWLASAGCDKVYTASDGNDALAVLEKTSIDLLVTDIRMPGMDGITLVRCLGEKKDSVPTIVFVSSFGEIDHREMYALGVEAFIAKPLLREELLEVLEKAVAERSSLWLTPMAVTPRQTMVSDMERDNKTSEARTIRLGRGGFSAPHLGALGRGRVTFRCQIPMETFELSGQGYVRWYSKADRTVGIEFYYLDSACRAWTLGQIAATNPRSFIPAS
jgi:CheY-like chemotaxis protein